uniref:Envelope fusion protein n=1 Tax=Sipha flava TaxID=143950 RepID=A0A2S2QPP7_9HEMI
MAYLSLTEYNEKYEYLEKSISESNENCKKDDKHRLICNKFDNIITRMFTEISMQRENIIISLGRDEIKREKRGIINIIENTLHVLFRVCDDECTKKVNRALIEQQKNSGNVLHLMKKQITLVKTAMQRIGASIEETQQLHEELRGKQQELVKRMNSLTNVTNDVLDLLLFNSVQNLHLALINQYAYETLMLHQIVTAARTGVIHTSLLTPKDLSETLNDIVHRLRTKMHLPMGTIPNELYEPRKIIKITIIYTQDKLLFVVKIPLVTEIELTMYNATPVPMMGNVTYILKPKQPFIAITKDRKQYTHSRVKNSHLSGCIFKLCSFNLSNTSFNLLL